MLLILSTEHAVVYLFHLSYRGLFSWWICKSLQVLLCSSVHLLKRHVFDEHHSVGMIRFISHWQGLDRCTSWELSTKFSSNLMTTSNLFKLLLLRCHRAALEHRSNCSILHELHELTDYHDYMVTNQIKWSIVVSWTPSHGWPRHLGICSPKVIVKA